MVSLKNGGKTENLKSMIASVKFSYSGKTHVTGGTPIATRSYRSFEMWMADMDGNESLSYLSLDEVLALRDELNNVLSEGIFNDPTK